MQSNRAAHVNQQRAQLQQARRPSPYNRVGTTSLPCIRHFTDTFGHPKATRSSSTADGASHGYPRLSDANRHKYPNAGAILAALITAEPAATQDDPTDLEIIKSLSFKKKEAVENEQAPMSATQAVRQVELRQARMQYEEVKALYQVTKDGVDALAAKAASGAIDKALMLSKQYLAELEETMREDEQRLLESLSSAHPDVVFVPTSFEPTALNPAGAPAREPTEQRPGQAKRKATNAGVQGATKRPKDVDPSIYLDIEAKESNKADRDDIAGPKRGHRRRIKSRAFVTQSDDEWPAAAVQINIADVVKNKAPGQPDDVEKEQAEEKIRDGEILPVDETSIFHVEKPDISELMKDPTPEEVDEIRQMRDGIKSSQFNWGDTLTISVCNVIRTWCYDEESTRNKPSPEDLTPHLMYIRALVDDRDMMTLRLQTYREREWTSHSIVKGHILTGYSILHNILADALKIVSFKNDHTSINIRQEGEDGVASVMVEQAKTMTWLARQCFVGDDDSAPRRGRIANATVRSLQKKYFHVLLGVNIVFESEVHNGLLMQAEGRGETVRKLKSMKANQKSETVLYQLFNDRNKHETARVKTIAGGKASKAIGSTSAAPSQSAGVGEKDKTLSAKNSRDVADFKKECLQYLSLFLMYGTASFFHVWPSYKDQTMPESALLINLASLVCDRRYERCGDEPHVFGARAWNRLDELMFNSLKMFVTDAGTFKQDIKWSDMTRHFYVEFDVKKLAALYMLDLLTETHRPGLSLGIEGQVMDHIRVKDDLIVKMNDPMSEPFRAIWGPTEGPLNPVADRGASLYPEVNSDGTLRRPHNPQTQMAADQARAKAKNVEDSSNGDEDAEDGGDESEEEEEYSEEE
ncbi:hypothetical protein DFH28DRAFT_1089987 [Melampsora americana]|nr:hypothetical protein DFH28DRAFT_1089987 [Melampsora americana]